MDDEFRYLVRREEIAYAKVQTAGTLSFVLGFAVAYLLEKNGATLIISAAIGIAVGLIAFYPYFRSWRKAEKAREILQLEQAERNTE